MSFDFERVGAEKVNQRSGTRREQVSLRGESVGRGELNIVNGSRRLIKSRKSTVIGWGSGERKMA